MKHYFEEIIRDHEELDAVALKHIESCSVCSKELLLMQKITNSISEMPEQRMPFAYKEQLLKLIQQPRYKIWHYLWTTLLLAISPLVLARFLRSSNINSPDLLYTVYAVFGSLAVIMLIPIATKLLYNYQHSVEEIEKTFDDYLANPSSLFHRH